MFESGFPKEYSDEVRNVERMLSHVAYVGTGGYCSKDKVEYWIQEQTVWLPYRVYLLEPSENEIALLTDVEQLILFCIYTRNHNGYLRENYLKRILCKNFPEWCFPYVVKLCSEYVVEILEVIYENLKDRKNDDIQKFCLVNKAAIRKDYARMVSYWNEYYRFQWYRFNEYIGRKLWRECLGYNKSFEK